MKIKHKLLASFLIATLVPVLVVALFTIRNVTEEARVQFEESSSLDVKLVNNTFETLFDSVNHTVSAMADYAAVRDTESGELTTYFGAPQARRNRHGQRGPRETDLRLLLRHR